MTPTKLIAALVPSFVLASTALAAPEVGATASLGAHARDVVHAEYSTFLVANGVTINYEHLLSDNLALRVGYGASGVWALTGGASAHGPLAMLVLLLGDDSKFELAGGVSVIHVSVEPSQGLGIGDDWFVTPSVFAGYRYQPASGGLVTRIGLGWTTGFGAIATFGVGYAF